MRLYIFRSIKEERIVDMKCLTAKWDQASCREKNKHQPLAYGRTIFLTPVIAAHNRPVSDRHPWPFFPHKQPLFEKKYMGFGLLCQSEIIPVYLRVNVEALK